MEEFVATIVLMALVLGLFPFSTVAAATIINEVSVAVPEVARYPRYISQLACDSYI